MIDRRAHIRLYVFEISCRAFAVPHTPIVKAHCGDSFCGERTAKQRELPVTADAVLGAAHYNYDTTRQGIGGAANDGN
jgi:hypothetical protein